MNFLAAHHSSWCQWFLVIFKVQFPFLFAILLLLLVGFEVDPAPSVWGPSCERIQWHRSVGASPGPFPSQPVPGIMYMCVLLLPAV